MRSARTGPCGRPSAGWRRCWAMIRLKVDAALPVPQSTGASDGRACVRSHRSVNDDWDRFPGRQVAESRVAHPWRRLLRLRIAGRWFSRCARISSVTDARGQGCRSQRCRTMSATEIGESQTPTHVKRGLHRLVKAGVDRPPGHKPFPGRCPVTLCKNGSSALQAERVGAEGQQKEFFSQD